MKVADLRIPDGPLTGATLREVFQRAFFQINPYFAAINKLGARGITLSENVQCDSSPGSSPRRYQRVQLSNLTRAQSAIPLGANGQWLQSWPVVQMVQAKAGEKPSANVTLLFEDATRRTYPSRCSCSLRPAVEHRPPTPSGGGGAGIPVSTVLAKGD